MAEQDVQDANPQNTPNASDSTVTQTPPAAVSEFETFPWGNNGRRLGDYGYYMRLFMGEHFDAFNIKIGSELYTREYSKLRYVMVNFAGLISKVVADMLFSEAPKFKSPDGDVKQQAYLDALVHENSLHIQNYESALSNSALGDAVYKLRVGPRNPGDEESTVMIEDITPTIYFPKVDGFNVRAEPREKILAWTFYLGKDKFLRKEIHTPGQIRNEVWSMEGEKIKTQQSISILGDPELKDSEDTLIDKSLVIHVPNWKTGNRTFGISDYADLDKLFYALNNRLTKVDNILDKHSDPILMVPPGVLDEKGNAKKGSLGVIEVREGETGKPEYIVWDASLENAFKEVDKIVEMLFMVSEVSPDVLGMGKGQNDSGRALKLKILRTIAKVSRKKLYYDHALKEVMFTAMQLAQAWKVKVGGLEPIEPFIPDIEWQDGLPVIMDEQVEMEAKRLDAGNTTVADSIMRLDGVDEDTAIKKAKEIKDENAIPLPSPFGTGVIGPKAGNTGGNNATNPTPDQKAQKPAAK